MASLLIILAEVKPAFFATAGELREWLERNHATATELLVGFYKRGSGRPSITWQELVDEELCFGWIDGVRQGIDEVSYSTGLPLASRAAPGAPSTSPARRNCSGSGGCFPRGGRPSSGGPKNGRRSTGTSSGNLPGWIQALRGRFGPTRKHGPSSRRKRPGIGRRQPGG